MSEAVDDGRKSEAVGAAPVTAQVHDAAIASRRQALRLGMVAGGIALTIKPAVAQAAASVISCNVDINTHGQMIAPDGSVVPAGTTGAFPGSAHYSGQSVYNALRGSNLPGASSAQTQAHLNYMRRLSHGQPGYTCFASLQQPR